MTLDGVHIGLALGGIVAGIVIDCNRRVRELQRKADQNAEWLHALISGRQLERKTDGDSTKRTTRRR